MDNPWLSLHRCSPYVLPDDWPNIKQFNDDLPPTRSRCRIHVDDVMPEPFAGAVAAAQVVVLLLNPGFDEAKLALHLKPEFQNTQWANLRHDNSEWPFYFFDPRFNPCNGEYPGVARWKKHTRRLAKAVGSRSPAIAEGEIVESVGWRVLACRLAVVEWFPYRSSKFGRKCRVPSQDYGAELVKNAIDRNALIVIGRGHDCWIAAVPKLAKSKYQRVLTLSSPRSAYLTRNNLKWWSKPKGDAWETLLEALCNDASE